MPFINEECIIEFPSPISSSSLAPNKKSLEESESTASLPSTSETFASNLSKLPSQGFMEMKRKQQLMDEEKKYSRMDESNSTFKSEIV